MWIINLFSSKKYTLSNAIWNHGNQPSGPNHILQEHVANKKGKESVTRVVAEVTAKSLAYNTRKCRTLWGQTWANWYRNIMSLMSDVTQEESRILFSFISPKCVQIRTCYAYIHNSNAQQCQEPIHAGSTWIKGKKKPRTKPFWWENAHWKNLNEI